MFFILIIIIENVLTKNNIFDIMNTGGKDEKNL